jgi:hypothetical protein
MGRRSRFRGHLTAHRTICNELFTVKQSAVNSAWFEDKEAEVATSPKRGRKRAPVDKERRELAQKVLLVAHDRLRTWEAVALFYGLSKAAAHRIANDNTYRPSKGMLNVIIDAGLPMGRRVWIDPCPDCGSVHHARCNGNGGTAVVLAAGETVRRPTRRKRPVVRRPWMGVELSAAMDAAGVTDDDVRRLVAATLAGPVPEVLP